MAIHLRDDVTALQARLFCRTAGLNGFDHYAVRGSQGLESNRIGADLFLEADANGAAGHSPLLDDLVVHLDRHGGRKRKTHSFVTAAAGYNRSVDANYLTGKINQRPAGIA